MQKNYVKPAHDPARLGPHETSTPQVHDTICMLVWISWILIIKISLLETPSLYFCIRPCIHMTLTDIHSPTESLVSWKLPVHHRQKGLKQIAASRFTLKYYWTSHLSNGLLYYAYQSELPVNGWRHTPHLDVSNLFHPFGVSNSTCISFCLQKWHIL